eukprot:scaffold21618_cov63-Attheya_sp.AAC.8
MSMSRLISLDHGHDDLSDMLLSLAAPTFDSGLSSSKSITIPSSSSTAVQAPTSKMSIAIKNFADINDTPRATLKGFLKASGIGAMLGTGDKESHFLIQQKINAYLARCVRNEGKRHNSDCLNFFAYTVCLFPACHYWSWHVQVRFA